MLGGYQTSSGCSDQKENGLEGSWAPHRVNRGMNMGAEERWRQGDASWDPGRDGLDDAVLAQYLWPCQAPLDACTASHVGKAPFLLS